MEGNTTTEEILDTAVEQDAGKAVAQEHQALLKQIRETIRGLYDAHGGQLHLSDILTEAGGGMHPTEFHFTITQVTLPVVQLTVGDKSFNAPIFTESRTGKRFAVGQIPW